ncbi:hypothetical protein EJB05_52803, partial [Eragrostis curvula]
MTWLQAMAFVYFGRADTPVEGILNRTNALGGPTLTYFKSKSDYARRAVGKAGWESIFRQHLSRNGAGLANGTAAATALGWLDGLYEFMAQFVSSNPREAFANYRDLDIGRNVVGGDGVSTYRSGRVWGERYFMGNYRKLAAVKARVDPSDYFRNEQSIPPLR